MTAVRLGIGTEISFDHRNFVVRRSLGDNLLQLEDEEDGHLMKLERRSLASAVASGSATICKAPSSRKSAAEADLTALPEDEQSEVRRRLTYVKLVERPEAPLTGKKLIQASIEIGAERLIDLNPPSIATLYGWVKAFRESSGDPCSLIPKTRSRGNRKRRFSPEVTEILDNIVNERFLITTQPRVSDIQSAVTVEITRNNRLRSEDDQLAIPSVRTLYRTIHNLDPYSYLEGRYGKLIADRETRHVGNGPTSSRPLERVEIDHTPLDIMVCDDVFRKTLGRPTLTTVMDHYTRMPLGFYVGFTPPSTAAVMLALRSAIKPKDWVQERYPGIQTAWPCYGIPETLVTDNGAEFHSNDLELACAQLGINIQHTRVKAPWTKGVIERFQGELNRQVFGSAPGKTFDSTASRGEYDSVAEAVIAFSRLEELLCKWIIEVHAKSVHSGIRAIPLDQWENGVKEFPPRFFSSSEDLDVLLACCRRNRKIHPAGICFERLWYKSRKLTELRNSSGTTLKVDYKFDPFDLGQIYVLDPRTNEYFTVPAAERDYAAGLGIWQHKVTRRYWQRYLADREDTVSIAEAREEIHRLIQAELASSKGKKTNKRAARYLEAGGPQKTAPKAIRAPEVGILPTLSAPEIEPKAWFDDEDDEDDDEFVVRDMQRVREAGRQK